MSYKVSFSVGFFFFFVCIRNTTENPIQPYELCVSSEKSNENPSPMLIYSFHFTFSRFSQSVMHSIPMEHLVNRVLHCTSVAKSHLPSNPALLCAVTNRFVCVYMYRGMLARLRSCVYFMLATRTFHMEKPTTVLFFPSCTLCVSSINHIKCQRDSTLYIYLRMCCARV